MKLIKLGLISVVVLFVLATLMGLMFPSTVVVSRAIDVTSPKVQLEQLVLNTLSWKKWVVENESDIFYTSPHQFKIGNNEVQVVHQNNLSIATLWKGSNVLDSKMTIYAGSDATHHTVQWSFTQKVKWYPWERFSTLMNDKILGDLMQARLQKLKSIAENPNQEN